MNVNQQSEVKGNGVYSARVKLFKIYKPTQESNINCLRTWWTLDGHLGDNTQRALWTNEQVLKVVACIIFLQRAQAIYHLTICFHLKQIGISNCNKLVAW
jgi:hypothetical protein